MFATGRTYDQIRNSVCYPNFNVKIVGTHGGITVCEDGASHQSLEDVNLMRGLPNMTVLVPCDCKECAEAVEFAANHYGPVYIRIPRTNVCDVFDSNYKFSTKAMVLKEGKDLSVITNGETIAEVIEASEMLAKKGIDVQIIHMPTVKPLDEETILNAVKKTNLVITVENHSIIGGIGSAVCELLSEKYPMPVYRIGVNDVFGQSGDWKNLMDFYGLSSEKLCESISKIMEKRV